MLEKLACGDRWGFSSRGRGQPVALNGAVGRPAFSALISRHGRAVDDAVVRGPRHGDAEPRDDNV